MYCIVQYSECAVMIYTQYLASINGAGSRVGRTVATAILVITALLTSTHYYLLFIDQYSAVRYSSRKRYYGLR